MLDFDEFRWGMTSMSIVPAMIYAISTWNPVYIRDQNLGITVPPDVVALNDAVALTFAMQAIKLDITFPFVL